jgi:hypothetical protein
LFKKGLDPLQRGDNYKNVKMGRDHLKENLLENYWPRKAEIHERFLTEYKIKFVKIMARGGWVGPQ